jgi:CheY-like chemotaxis protein
MRASPQRAIAHSRFWRWEAVRRLKSDPIGTSAYALDSEREEAIATSCYEFDAKPIDFERLVATIRRVLANPK